jgi:hypothetical protein
MGWIKKSRKPDKRTMRGEAFWDLGDGWSVIQRGERFLLGDDTKTAYFNRDEAELLAECLNGAVKEYDAKKKREGRKR